MPKRKHPEHITSYLDHLTFPKELGSGWLGKYVTNIRFVILLIVAIVLVGVVSYLNLPKRLNPEVKIPIVSIVTVFPGAGPADVESLVTVPLENAVRGVEGVDVVQSVSRDNLSAITLQFFSSVDPDEAKDAVQSAVDVVGGLPQGAQRPTVRRFDFEDVPVWTFALTGKGSIPDLMRSSEELMDRLEEAGKIDRVVTTGLETQQIVVEMNPQKLASYGLNPGELGQKIRAARSSYPAGVVQTSSTSFSVAIDPVVESTAQIRDLPIALQGSVVPLGDIATVMERSKYGEQQSFLVSPNKETERTVQFYVYKTTDANITEAGDEAQKIVDDFIREKNGSFSQETLINTSDEIRDQLSDILSEFQATILLVAFVLFLFLGFRQALISCLTVPLTFLATFVIMQYTGMSINFLSLFAFLLSLGLLVDDTIVVVSTMTAYYRSGKFTPVQTGLLVWRDTIVPIWSTTITTIWSFVPLLLASGIIGEFIKPIPIVVTATLLSSTAIAVLITLPLMIVLLKPSLAPRVKKLIWFILVILALSLIFVFANTPIFILIAAAYVLTLLVAYRTVPPLYKSYTKRLGKVRLYKRVAPFIARATDRGIIDVEGLARRYKRLMLRILKSKSARRKVITAIVIYSLFSFMLLPLGFVKNEFFPKEDTNQFYIQVEYPPGTTNETVRAESQNLIPQVKAIPHLEYAVLETGKVFSESDNLSGQTNAALFTVRLTEPGTRSMTSIDIAEDLRKKFSTYTQGRISVLEQSGGPPAGADVQIALLGPDLTELNRLADQVQEFLAKRQGLTNVDKSVKPGTSKIVFIPDQRKLAAAGVSQETIGQAMNLFTGGFPLDQIALEEGSDKKTEVVLALRNGNASADALSQITVTGARGVSYPIYELGRFESRVSPTAITREDGQRTISVSAATRPGVNSTVENEALLDYVEQMNFPAGYTWKTGGVNEENAKSVQSILQAMLLSTVLILITMVVQFQSFRKALIVLLVIPLAVSSVFLFFAVVGIPLSFPALIGVLSLFGIVVTNSMFIVDKININRREGMDYTEAIADAGASRLEPIILTKLTSVFGLLPITLSEALWRGLGGAIISGLLVASTIMLFFIPVVYYNWMKDDTPKSSL